MAESTSGAGSRPPGLSTVQSLTIASQFGGTLAVAVALGLFAGQWIDTRLGVSPLFTLIGVFFGFAAAVSSTVALYRTVLRRNERVWEERRRPMESATASANDQTDE